MNRISWLLISSVVLNTAISRAQDAPENFETTFQSDVRPLLKQFCAECHSPDRAEAEVDLVSIPSVAEARRGLGIWIKVREMLDSDQMPPQDDPQPSDAQRAKLQKWVRAFLLNEARAQAGDPGPVVLRRLSNDEYNYSVRDLTGVPSLNPTREFPVDSAAGEGFTNAGAAQAMSPSLVTKYLDAGKDVAAHAVLLPDGIRFSDFTSQRDRTDELLAAIQTFYRQFTEGGGGQAVDLQGIKFDTNQGGLLPIEKYFAATLQERDALSSGAKSVADVARDRALNEKYLGTLWQALRNREASFLLSGLQQQWQQAGPNDAGRLAESVRAAQNVLWKFNSIGHIGRQDGPKSWLEAVSPIVPRVDLRLPLATGPEPEAVVYLAAGDLGDGNESDFVVWQRPRIEFKAEGDRAPHPPILLRNVPELARQIRSALAAELPKTDRYLAAVAKLSVESRADGATDDSIEAVAAAQGLNAKLLRQWSEVVGLNLRAKRDITGLYTTKLERGAGYADINGWGSNQTPSVSTNRSRDDISFLTLTIPARSVVVHPSPAQESIVAWRSPISGRVEIKGLVADSDDKCGNGAAWRVELLSESGSSILADGAFDSGGRQTFQPEAVVSVAAGDVVFLFVNPRDRNHACDTTLVELTLSEVGGESRRWDLAADVVDRILESNPLPDSYRNPDVWHFGATNSEDNAKPVSAIEPGSQLAEWKAAVTSERSAGDIAAKVRDALIAEDIASLNDADARQRAALRDWKGPLRWSTVVELATAAPAAPTSNDVLDIPFGQHPDGSAIDDASLCLKAPRVLTVRLPRELVGGGEFVVSGELHGGSGENGSVQLQLLASKPDVVAASASASQPVIVKPGSAAQQRIETAMTEFRELFPAALCYARIVPVDEVVTLRLFYREDDSLQRLMLNEQQTAQLDRLWDELFFVSEEPLKLAVSFEQLSEFATQDRPDLVVKFEPMRKPINERAEAFRRRVVQARPAQLAAVSELAGRAWRRPLSDSDRDELRRLYAALQDAGVAHEESIDLMIARILTSPAFLYRREEPAPGSAAAAVTSNELATRLSYFLWSSLEDDELRQVTASGRLTDDAVLIEQTRRMLKDERTRRLAIQFACQWLHLRNFDQNDDKNEALYPEFASLRGAMYEETVRFFEDMFRNDGSILGLLDADHTFVNPALAKHYGIDFGAGTSDAPSSGTGDSEWRRVSNVRAAGRGGVLGMATFLASQSGASRTSPILRGNWLSETLLGEKLPKPPANVPRLPETVPDGLTARELIEHHSSVPACAKCHVRIDPYGFALEQFDAIGRQRPVAADTKTKLMGGEEIEGLSGLRDYLVTKRRDDVLRQFCRKLLGFALGREVQLSDEPLLDDLQIRLAENDFRFSVAIETIVTSDQFRKIRGTAALTSVSE